MDNAPDYKPYFVGISPAGVEYVAYKAKDIDHLEGRLARLWKRHLARRIRVRGLTPAQAEHALSAASVLDCKPSDRNAEFGRTWVEASHELLFNIAQDLEYDAEHGDHEAQIEGGSLRELNSGFVAASAARRVACLKAAAEKIRKEINREYVR